MTKLADESAPGGQAPGISPINGPWELWKILKSPEMQRALGEMVLQGTDTPAFAARNVYASDTGLIGIGPLVLSANSPLCMSSGELPQVYDDPEDGDEVLDAWGPILVIHSHWPGIAGGTNKDPSAEDARGMQKHLSSGVIVGILSKLLPSRHESPGAHRPDGYIPIDADLYLFRAGPNFRPELLDAREAPVLNMADRFDRPNGTYGELKRAGVLTDLVHLTINQEQQTVGPTRPERDAATYLASLFPDFAPTSPSRPPS